MNATEQELADAREYLKRLALELQRLEEKRPLRMPADWDDHDRQIAEVLFRIGYARSTAQQLEGVIAKGQGAPRSGGP